MRDCKKSIINAPVLRNLTTTRAILYNETRWTGKHDVLEQYLKLREHLLDAHNDPATNFRMNTNHNFASSVAKYQKQLKWIKNYTKVLQTKFLTLADCRVNLDMLISDVQEHRNTPGHDLYQCRLGSTFIGSSSIKIPNLNFQTGVVKIQNDEVCSMTHLEHAACASLRLGIEEVADADAGNVIRTLTHSERLEQFKRRKRSKLVFCIFLLLLCAF